MIACTLIKSPNVELKNIMKWMGVFSPHVENKRHSRLLSKAEELQVEALISAHDPVVITKPTTDQMISALWKKVMLGDSSDADKILAIYE